MNSSTRGQEPALVALFAMLVAVYLVTGSGGLRIIDEGSLFGVTESIVKRGAFDTNVIAWTQWANSPGEVLGSFGPGGDVFSKKGPAPAFLAIPFYLVGWLFPRLGMLQTTLWFNALVTALTALVLARTVQVLGYGLESALFAGAAYGLDTIALPYATYFFGEPLSTLAILGIFYSLLRFRQTEQLLYAVWAGLAAAVMIATSVAHAILLAPFGIYSVYAVWQGAQTFLDSTHKRFWLRVVTAALMFVIPLACGSVLVAWYNWIRFGTPFTTGYHFDAGEGFTADWAQGLWGLLFSPYRGFFWYTPLTVMSVAAWPRFIRHHPVEGWLLAAISLMLVGLFSKWWMWWGGFAWGPRFLVPLAPLVVLILVPWLDKSGLQTRSRWVFCTLMALSVIVQLLAVSVNYVNFEIVLRNIYPTDWRNPLRYGPPALFNPAHSPILGQIQLLLEDARTNLSLAWISTTGISWQVPLVALGVVLLTGVTWWTVWRSSFRAAWMTAALSLVSVSVLAVISAQIYSTRPEFGDPQHGYAAALAEIGERAAPEDGVVTIAPFYYQIPMARHRGRLPIYGYATETLPLHPETESVLTRALTRHPRLWLVTVGLPPADPSNGVEAWLADHSFKAEDHWLDDARVVVFASAKNLASVAMNVRLGDRVRLVGVQTSAQNVRRGDTLAVELNWQVDAPPDDLRGFVQLLTPDDRFAAGQDGVPGGGYLPSTEWQPGTLVKDRRGLLLPGSLQPGNYTLIAGLYHAGTGERLPVTDANGVSQGDSVRLGMITIK